MFLTRFEQKSSLALINVGEEEVVGFRCHRTVLIAPHSAVADGVELLVKFLLGMGTMSSTFLQHLSVTLPSPVASLLHILIFVLCLVVTLLVYGELELLRWPNEPVLQGGTGLA